MRPHRMRAYLMLLVAVIAVFGGCTSPSAAPSAPTAPSPTVTTATPPPTTPQALPPPTTTATPSATATATVAPPPSPTSTTTAAPTVPAPTPAEPPVQAAGAVSPAEVLRGDTSQPWIALVFNVGAGHEPALSILDTLAAKQYRASFFVMGWWAERQPDVLRKIAAGGHEIASHGHSVFDLRQVSDEEVRADLQAADRVIAAVTGRTTRPLWSPSAGYRDARVRRIAADLGFRTILWTADSGDWTYEATASSITERVMANAGNGAIMVMHFDSPTTVQSTAAALPGLIDRLRAAGYRLVTIGEMLGLP